MQDTPTVCHNARLPLRIQQVLLASPIGRHWLRENPHLADRIWNQLTRTHTTGDSIRYLHHNLSPARVKRAVKLLPSLDLEPYRLANLAMDISSCLRRDGMDESMAKTALTTGQPVFANAILEAPAVSLETKLAAAPLAYMACRLAWLTSLETEVLDDAAVWQQALLPDTLEPDYRGTALDDILAESEVDMAAGLLYLRPRLVDQAIATGLPRWLLAAGSVRLDESQQLALIEQNSPLFEDRMNSSRHLLHKEVEHYLGPSGRTRLLDPLGTVASMPWCSDAVWEYLNFTPAPEDPRLSFTKGDTLYRRDRLGYERHLPVRSRATLVNGDWSEMTEQQLWDWANRCRGDNEVGEFFRALDMLTTRGLPPRVRREARNYLKVQNTRFPTLLARLRGRWDLDKVRPRYSAYGVNPDTDTPITPVALGLDARPAEHYHFSSADLGLSALAAANLTAKQWELALTLLGETFQGTVADLISTVCTTVP